MSIRIDIELTSARPDGTWTWRAAGAQKPKGVVDGGLLPAGSAVGAVLRAEAERELDGMTILSVATAKAKTEKTGLLEMLVSDKPFEAVTQQLARRERGERSDHDRGPRRDGDKRPSRERSERERRPDGDRRPGGDKRPGRDRPEGDRRPTRERPDGPRRPRFEAPPELPQRPKAKRLKPGRVHRNAALAALPEAQRAVAERVLQGGLPAVRAAVNEQNAKLKAEGKEEIPAAGLLKIAEQVLPQLRVAEWLDRADAAVADIEELDLRDLRSVVAAAEDPMVARDETTRELAARLKEALVSKQEKELALWFADIDAAVGVGRVVRALKLSSQPPKAGVRFPAEIAARLAAATTANLTTDALPDRWVAVLEALAFSPIRSQVRPTAKPTQENDELLATVKRLGSLLPQIAELFGVEIDPKAQPKPLRPTRPTGPQKGKPATKGPKATVGRTRRDDAAPATEAAEAAPAAEDTVDVGAAQVAPEPVATDIAEPVRDDQAVSDPADAPVAPHEHVAETAPETAPETDAASQDDNQTTEVASAES
jgi:hypothetical protein